MIYDVTGKLLLQERVNINYVMHDRLMIIIEQLKGKFLEFITPEFHLLEKVHQNL